MKGEITVFFSLVFILLISFSGALLESASLQTLKNERREDMSLAMDSVFAEYQKELFEKYDLFSLDASYESGTFSEEAVGDRLNKYGQMQAEQSVVRMQLLTDYHGQAFYEQAVRYAEDHYGADLFQKALQLSDLWKEKEGSLTEDPEKKMDSVFGEVEGILPGEDNALTEMVRLRRQRLPAKVLPAGTELSDRRVNVPELVSRRTLNKGRGEFKAQVLGSDSISDMLFETYLEEHFGNAASPAGDTALSYEMEYLLHGSSSDTENLDAVLKKLLWIRLACNYGYLQTDAERKEQASLWAAGISVLILMPESEELICQALLLAWAYGESIQDLRCLLAGKKVPFWKQGSQWQTKITDLLLMGYRHTLPEEEGEGFSYTDYLKCLYLLEKKEDVRMRALDLIEMNLRKQEETGFFRADACINKLEMETACRFRRGIVWHFHSYYEYV